QDRPRRRVAVEAAEPRQPEEPRHDEDPDAAQRDRPRVEVEPVEPPLRGGERRTRRPVHGAIVADAPRARSRRAGAVASPDVKRRLLRLLERARLIGPAFRAWEAVQALSPRPRPAVDGPPLPPRRLMVRVAGTADPE